MGDVVTGYGQKVVGLPEAKTSGLVMCGGAAAGSAGSGPRHLAAHTGWEGLSRALRVRLIADEDYVVGYSITPALLGDPQSKVRPTRRALI